MGKNRLRVMIEVPVLIEQMVRINKEGDVQEQEVDSIVTLTIHYTKPDYVCLSFYHPECPAKRAMFSCDPNELATALRVMERRIRDHTD